MTERVREKMFKVAGGVESNFPHLHFIYSYVHHEPILDYLISQGITGPKFSEFISTRHQGSPMLAVGSIIKILQRKNTPDKLILGENFRT